MNNKRHLGLVAAGATLLAAIPIGSVFADWTWLFQCAITVGLIAAAATAIRSMRGRLWLQLLGMAGALLISVTFLFGDHAFLGLIPTVETFRGFGDLLMQSGEDIRTSFIPAADTPALLMLTTLGIGSMAILIDLLAIGLRRPALAGLPMLAIYSVPVAVQVDSVSPVPFLFGAAGFMWLLVSDNLDRVRRFGRRFTGEGRGVDVWEPSPLAAAGRRLAVTGLILAVLLPLGMPGLTSGLYEGWLGGAGGTGGEGNGAPKSGRVDLFAELSGQLNQDEITDLARVRTDEEGPFYLRFGVADDIVDSGFRSSAPNGSPVDEQLPVAPGMDRTGKQHTAKIEVFDTFNMPLLPIYASPTAVRGLAAAWAYDPSQQVVYSQRELSAKQKYEFDYIRARYSPDELRTSQPLPAGDRLQQRYARVIEVPEVRRQVDELIKDKETVYDKVRALHDFFSEVNDFRYDETAPTGTSGDKIVDFLNNRRGFCEQYAAALAWMVRTAGIPARVAFGFTRGNGANSPDGAVLTNRNLHAWTEVYFDGFGWVPFDATPSLFVSGSINLPHDPDPDRTEPPETPGGPSAGPTGSAGPQGTNAPGRDPFDDPNSGDFTGAIGPAPTPLWVWWAYGGLAALLLALVMPALRRVVIRRRRSLVPAGPGLVANAEPGSSTMIVVGGEDSGRARSLAHAAWDELVDTMVDLRLPVDPAETPRGTADRLIGLYKFDSVHADQAILLGRAEERARYAPKPLTAQNLVDALLGLRTEMLRQAPRKIRLIAVLMPPSVVQRWRERVSSAALRANERISAFNAAARRLSEPLRLNRLFRRA